MAKKKKGDIYASIRLKTEGATFFKVNDNINRAYPLFLDFCDNKLQILPKRKNGRKRNNRR